MGHIIFTCVVLFLLRLNEPATSFDNLPYLFGSLLGNILFGIVILSIAKRIVKPKGETVPTGNAVVAFVGASLIASGISDYRTKSEVNEFQSAFNDAVNQNITGITAAQDGIYDEIDVTALETGDLERATRMDPMAGAAEIMKYIQYRTAELDNEYLSSTNSVNLDNLLIVNENTSSADYQVKFGEINKLVAALGRYVTAREQVKNEVHNAVTQSGWPTSEKQAFSDGLDNSPVDTLVVENLNIEGDVLALMRQYLEILRGSDWTVNVDDLYVFESEESLKLFESTALEMQEKVDRQEANSAKIIEVMRELQSKVNAI